MHRPATRGPARLIPRGGTVRSILIPVVLLSALAAWAVGDAPIIQSRDVESSQKVEITFLVNAGFLLRSGDKAVLIDAFVEHSNTAYGALPDDIREAMVTGRPPFESIRLALVSHYHRDHFQPGTAHAFLKNHTETLLVSSPEVLKAIRNDDAAYEEIEPRLREAWPAEGAVLSLELRGIPVEFVQLSHEGSDFYPAQCLGHIIHLDGKKILHVGDAELRAERFGPLALGSRDIDIALIPYWLLKLESTPAFLREHIAAKTLVATHIPPPLSHEEIASEISKQFPEVVLLRQPLDSIELP